MSDLDRQIRSALEAVVRAAPPPVPVDSFASRGRPSSSRSRAGRLALLASVAAIVLWLAATDLRPGADSSSSQGRPVELEAGDDGVERTPEPEPRFAAIEGRWLSETVPRVAEQLATIEEEQLWLALEAVRPRDPYGKTIAPEAADVTGLAEARLRWEGLLFPSTYFVDGTDDASTVVARMHDEFLRVADDLGYDRSMDRVGRSPYEVVIVASLVEAEAFTDADRGKIARVIYNRLAAAMPLAIDTSYIYAAQDRGVELTAALLERPGPYGLRTEPGLPATPIGAPGRSSLQAAIEPTAGDWLFYTLADEAGNHVFAETLADHSANVAAARERGLLD